MAQIDAIYQNGVFKPLQDVGLSENQRVRLSVHPVEVGDVQAWQAWLAEVEERQQRIIAERGYFPDSTVDIAEDRRR
jgi:predicted DNA-binding antitoxin AbrB/MazE fold protein